MLTFITSAIRFGMSLLCGSTGETITEKSGHLNLGIPGVMCVGAASGCLATSKYMAAVGGLTGKSFPVIFFCILISLLACLIGGALMGLIYSFLTVSLGANQNVTGLALTTFGVGVSSMMVAKTRDFVLASRYFTASLPFAHSLGWFGELFLSYGVLIYISIAIAIVASIILTRTRLGLQLRAVGESPATADAAGINVKAYRYGATCVGCSIAALGGFIYIMDNLEGNWEYTIDSIGWLAVALVIFTVWKPVIGIFGSIIFGALYICSPFISLSMFSNLTLNQMLAVKDLIKILPYVVTILVLVITSIRNKRENQAPAGLGVNYYREDR